MNTPTTNIGPMTTSSEWVERLAVLINVIRPDWGVRGIRAALRKVSNRPLRDVTLAALAATARTDQRTPAIIALDGEHWRQAGSRVRGDQPIPCDICRAPGPEACARAQAIVLDPQKRNDHAYQPERPRAGRGPRRPLPDLHLPEIDEVGR